MCPKRAMWLAAALLLAACSSPSGHEMSSKVEAEITAVHDAKTVHAGSGPHMTPGTNAGDLSVARPVWSGELRASYYECAANNDGSTWDMQRCVEDEFEYQDARLNSAYRKLRSKLSGTLKQKLKQEEQAWIAERDAKCEWTPEVEGQAQRVEANVCLLKKTAARADLLERSLETTSGS